MTKLLLTISAFFFVLQIQVALSETHTISSNRFDKLASDDDPITGLWQSAGDSAMTYYMLIEKHVDGDYRVSRYSDRYAIAIWTGKVERVGDEVYFWNYYIDGQALAISENYSQAYTIQDGQLKSQGHTHYYLISVHNEEEWLDNTQRLLGKKFTTGERYFERKLDRLIELERRIPEGFKWSSKLPDRDLVFEFTTLAHTESEMDKYIIAYLKSYGYKYKRSGYCGSSEDESYFWVHLQNVKGQWQIVDDWFLSNNQCLSGAELAGAYRSQDQTTFIGTTQVVSQESECFLYKSDSPSTKPKKCNDSDLEFFNNY